MPLKYPWTRIFRRQSLRKLHKFPDIRDFSWAMNLLGVRFFLPITRTQSNIAEPVFIFIDLTIKTNT
jgi:hypothetical protein